MFELVLRIGFSLLVVFGLMWGLAKVARRPLSGHRGTGNLSVLNRQQLARGAANKEIAYELGITERTARTHVSNILGKLGLASRTQAALYAVENKLV